MSAALIARLDGEPLSQRWRDGNSCWAPTRSLIDTGRHRIERIGESQARAFLCRHHYSGTMGVARLAVGLFRKEAFQSERLAGVAVFGVPIQPAAAQRWCGLPAPAVVDLNRLALLDEVEFNGESWFVARALALLHKILPEVRGLICYSDPVPRRRADGSTLMPGHRGQCYQSVNMRFVGRSSARTLTLAGDGRVFSERALSKLRNGESGADYAQQQLEASGAPKRNSGESGAAYLQRALAAPGMRRLRHPGNFVYVTGIGRHRSDKGLAPALPYPRQALTWSEACERIR